MAKKIVQRDPETGKTHTFKADKKKTDPDTLPYTGKVTKHRGAGIVDITRYLRGK